jgi:hypothetical protein
MSVVKTTSPVTIAIVYFQSKLYAIGMLYSLNVRKSLVGMGRSQMNDTASHDDFWSPRATTDTVVPSAPSAPSDETQVIEMGKMSRQSRR